MTQGGTTTRIALGLAASALACLMLPAAAQAQYPYGWHAATPPSWLAESTDSSCQPREQYIEWVDGEDQWVLLWASPGRYVCFKPIPPSPELGPGIGFYCSGSVSRFQETDGSPDSYRAVWECSVGDGDTVACKRWSAYGEQPLGNPIESYDSGWYDPWTGAAEDCRPKGSGGDESELRFGKVKLNKSKGTATLPVTVPGSGQLTVGGKGVVKKRPGLNGRWLARKVNAAGTYKLKVKAKGRKKRKLFDTGKVRVKAVISFKPTSGDKVSDTKRIRLKKN